MYSISAFTKYYKTLTIKRPYGEQNILIARTSSCRNIYRTFSTLYLSKDTQLSLAKNINLQQNFVYLCLQKMIVYIFTLSMHLYHHMYKRFSIGRHRFHNGKVTYIAFIIVPWILHVQVFRTLG